ncbi:MAG: TorF family putative porin, partial [Candidatus Dechloromonas phosphoritropha]
MNKSLVALALAGAFALPALAQTASSERGEAPSAEEEASPHTITGNMTIATDYRFRGISQTFGKPAIQGGVDYLHESGIYVGNWNSNVNEATGFSGGSVEMDFYGGWKKSFDDFGVDIGVLYYYYPGTSTGFYSPCNFKTVPFSCATGRVDNTEIYLGLSWKTLSFKWSHALSDYFSIPDTSGTNYFDLSGSYDFGEGWGINAHVGYTDLRDFRSFTGNDGKYTDWKIGVTKDISGWVIGLAYVDTNAKGSAL